MIVQIRDGQRDDLPEKLSAQAVDDPLAQPRGEEALQKRCAAVEDIDAQHPAEEGQDGAEPTGDQLVDDAALQSRRDHTGCNGQYDCGGKVDHIATFRPEISGQPPQRLLSVLWFLSRSTHARAAAAEALLGDVGPDFAHTAASSLSWES